MLHCMGVTNGLWGEAREERVQWGVKVSLENVTGSQLCRQSVKGLSKIIWFTASIRMVFYGKRYQSKFEISPSMNQFTVVKVILILPKAYGIPFRILGSWWRNLFEYSLHEEDEYHGFLYDFIPSSRSWGSERAGSFTIGFRYLKTPGRYNLKGSLSRSFFMRGEQCP